MTAGPRAGPARGVALALLLLAAMQSAAFAGPRRVAVVVGQNVGLPAEAPLQHATRDARRVGDVLEELGRFDRVVRVEAPTAERLTAALAALPERPEVLVFYYSGHAGQGSLHLAGGSLPGREVVAALDAASPALRIAVFDACESGDLARAKGLAVTPAAVSAATAPTARGRVLLASSSPGQAAQESDRLGGAFFTAHLVAGLRGAADRDRDGQVSLREVYAYARARTMDDTFLSAAGVQRPTYRLRLDGEADVALTWVEGGGGRLELGGGGAGRYLVSDAADGRVLAEVVLTEGERRTLTFPAGRYQVKKRERAGALVGEIALAADRAVRLRDADLERVPFVSVVEKGAVPGAYTVGVRVTSGVAGAAILGGLDLGYVFELVGWSVWPSARITAGRAAGDAVDRDTLAADVGVAVGVDWSRPRWRISLGARPSVVWVHQRLGALGTATGALGQAELLFGVDAWLADDLGVFATVAAGGTVGREVSDPRGDAPTWTPRPIGSVGVGARWR